MGRVNRMASYIGNKPVAGEFKRLDSIAGQFNGVLTSFSLNFNSVSVSAGDASQLIVSLDGVVQEPLGAYTLGVGGSTIVFGTAPVAGSTCHIVQLGGVGGTITGTLTDNIVTTAKIGAGAVTSDRITIDNDISFPTNDKLIFGNSLKAFHDGSDGFITNDTGQLILRVASVESALVAVPNGAVTLYHDSQPKIATTSTGVDVTGNVTADGLTVDGSATFVSNSGANNLFIDGRSADNIGQVTFRSNNGATNYSQLQSRSTELKIKTLANIPMSFHTNNSPRITILNSGNVGIGEEVPLTALHVSSSSYPYVRITNDGYTGFDIGQADAGEGGAALVKLRDAADMDFYTADLNRMRISSIGNVGIGLITTDPSHKLHVKGDVKADQYLLDSISKEKSEQAIDIFVYDTRKDSDGGAWRKRTQNTSWYNEALNTATRGSRREFPSVAVLSLTTSTLTIYDGDDPDLPMWMVFTGSNAGSSYTWFGADYTGENATCVSMLNAKLCIGVQGTVSSVSGLSTVHFIDEIFKKYGGATGFVRRPVAYRNQAFTVQPYMPYNLRDDDIRDVAMKVLPNAPIDPDNGLPVPTIAVATATGISVIRDNQKDIWDITAEAGSSYDPSNSIDFTESGKIIFDQDNANRSIFYMDIPDSDTQSVTNDGVIFEKIIAKHYPTGYNDIPAYLGDGVADLIAAKGESQVFRATSGQLTLVDPDKYRSFHTSTCFIGTDYNTGWMQGASKLSLSSTDDTDVTGTSKLTSNLYTGFTVTSGGGFAVNGNGTVSVTNGNGSSDGILTSPSFNLVVGQRYIIDIQASNTSGVGVGIYLNGSGGPNAYLWDRQFEFVATQVSNTFFLYRYLGHTGSATLDKVVIYEAEANRSVYGQTPLYGGVFGGLQVFGTVVKSAVETGAELVSYRSNGSSYLSQPFAGALDISGSKDVSFTWWQRHNGGGGVYEGWKISEDSLDQSAYGNVVVSMMHEVSTDSMLIRGRDITGAGVINGIISKEWVCMTLNVDTNGKIELYTNGKLSLSTTGTLFNPSDRYSLRILQWSYSATNYYCTNSDITMFRTSNTLPNAQRIKRSYEQERPLFAANAKATIAGSDEYVRAIAYDDSTDELHVGTLDGRSVFRGLNRIDSTSDEVSNVISASNGLVAER